MWVSEVMLQQTQVATVEPYFRRWMARFPTLAALAEADLQDVLATWQGLGYYRRARALHQAARQVVAGHGGRLPEDEAALRELPGLGDYSAGAIASIAFRRPAPAVDGNARRVLARLAAIPGDVAAGVGARRVREMAGALHGLGPGLALGEPGAWHPGDLNQALMELGATVCRPRRPVCEACPLAPGCQARRLGLTEALPEARPRSRPTPVHAFTFALRDKGGLWLVARRADEGLWAGLWEFPGLAGDADADPVALLAAAVGLSMAPGWRRAGELVHILSHRRLTTSLVLGRLDEPMAVGDLAWPPYAELRWVLAAELRGRRLPRSRRMDRLIEAIGVGSTRANA